MLCCFFCLSCYLTVIWNASSSSSSCFSGNTEVSSLKFWRLCGIDLLVVTLVSWSLLDLPNLVCMVVRMLKNLLIHWLPDANVRLNATDFLERMRGRKLVFVGDSLNRNMWESLVCMLWHSIKDKKRVYEVSGKKEFKKEGYYAFRFEARSLAFFLLRQT